MASQGAVLIMWQVKLGLNGFKRGNKRKENGVNNNSIFE